ncbi:MAG: RNA polymerase sigma-70 factor [Marinilabiliales bacterium]
MDNPGKNILLINYNDEKFFNAIFDKYYLSLFYYAKTFVNNQEIAEDIVQETFLKIWQKKEQIKNYDSIQSYLFVSVKNTCLDYLKHNKTANDYKNQENFNSLNNNNTDHLIRESEIKAQLHKAIDTLPPQCRTVFTLSRFENMKQKDIAKKLGISLKTVENHMGKALMLIKEKMKDFL